MSLLGHLTAYTELMTHAVHQIGQIGAVLKTILYKLNSISMRLHLRKELLLVD